MAERFSAQGFHHAAAATAAQLARLGSENPKPGRPERNDRKRAARWADFSRNLENAAKVPRNVPQKFRSVCDNWGIEFICVLAHTPLDEEGEEQMPQALMSIAQVCDQTGLGRTRVYEELTSGRLKSVKVGAAALSPPRCWTNGSLHCSTRWF